METPDQQFSDDLMREDDVGLVLRGHLHIEHQLMELISIALPFKERCDWSRIGYRGKIELALSCGLREDMRQPLKSIGSLRNNFAHDLGANIEKKKVMDIYNGLSERLRKGVKVSYAATGRQGTFKPSQLVEKDLLVLLFVNFRQAIRAAILTLQGMTGRGDR